MVLRLHNYFHVFVHFSAHFICHLVHLIFTLNPLALHFRHPALHFTLCTLPSTPCTLRFTLCTSHFTVCSLHLALHTYTRHLAVRTIPSVPHVMYDRLSIFYAYGLRWTFYSWCPSLCFLLSTWYHLQSSFYSLRSTSFVLHTLHVLCTADCSWCAMCFSKAAYAARHAL